MGVGKTEGITHAGLIKCGDVFLHPSLVSCLMLSPLMEPPTGKQKPFTTFNTTEILPPGIIIVLNVLYSILLFPNESDLFHTFNMLLTYFSGVCFNKHCTEVENIMCFMAVGVNAPRLE